MRSALKSLRAIPALNGPLTTLIRAVARWLNVTPAFAMRHLPRSGLTVTALPNGRRARFWSRGDDWVSNQVFWRGWDAYEPEVAPLFWRLAEEASVIVDVGAHVGYYTVLGALANPTAMVLAFEPLPTVFARLERNIALNRVENVTALQLAAGAVDGRERFYHVPGIIPSSSSLSLDFMGPHEGIESIEVQVRRLDTFVQERSIDRIDLIKLDVETAEPDVLAGMGALLAECHPNIICEVLTAADTQTLTSILEPLGYAFYHLTDRGPEPTAVIRPHGRWLNYFFTARRASAEHFA